MGDAAPSAKGRLAESREEAGVVPSKVKPRLNLFELGRHVAGKLSLPNLLFMSKLRWI